MRKLAVLAVLALGLAWAQQPRLFGEALSGGVTLAPSFGLSAQVAAGATQVLGPLDLRASASIFFVNLPSGSITGFGVAADVLFPLPLETAPLRLDVGVGLGLVGVGGLTDFGARALVGLEFPIQGPLSVRLEPTLSYSFNSQQFAFGANLGPRVYLR